mmetsp:Transcript_9778/g.16460  ORF Transcript_9778/g.16460 Transcript_9778/m.16460 type:complete len:345 (-) Transcript_9778:16-1050(-)
MSYACDPVKVGAAPAVNTTTTDEKKKKKHRHHHHHPEWARAHVIDSRTHHILKRQFKKFDKNKNGYLEKDELREFLTAVNVAAHPSAKRALYKMYARNPNKRMTLNDLEAILSKLHEKNLRRETELANAFDYFDKDQDGVLSEAEANELLKYFSTNSNHNSRKLVFEKYDKNHDGTMTFHEFHTLVDDLENRHKEKKIAAELFDKFDKDKSGKLEPLELAAFFESLHVATTGQERVSLYKSVGAIDGALTRDQFFEIFVRAREEAVRRQLELRQLFKQFDPEKKGLHPKELGPLLLKVGIDVPVSDLKVKMAAHDSNFDGRLSFEEFQEVLFEIESEGQQRVKL